MKKYFLHNGTESSGPFDFEELKAKKITLKTPVWFDGMEKWKFAGEIPELDSVFNVSPPTFQHITEVSEQPKAGNKPQKRQILGLSKSTFFIVLGVLALVVVTIIFNTLNENRKLELDAKNYRTEVENRQLELKEKEIQEQKIIQAEAEKAAAQRAIQDRKQLHSDRIIALDKLIAISQSNLEATKKKLTNASVHKISRTATEKQEEVNALQTQIDSIYKDIDQLKIESNKLKLEVEKIP
jgi:hypothetical protein